jgi:DNA-binding FadR family transcriptional regulator
MTSTKSSNIPPLTRRPHNVSVGIAAHFEGLIATGGLAAGERLPSERELAVTLGVSRSSLREAMHELETKHLIERKPGRGTTVLGRSAGVDELLLLEAGASDLEHAVELRLIIEPSVASLAATRATPANILQLQEVLDKAHENVAQAESLRLDVEFHLLLAQAAQNPLLATLQSLASEWTGEVRKRSHASREGRRLSVGGHDAILRAVLAQDALAARAAMEEHLRDVRGIITREAAAR